MDEKLKKEIESDLKECFDSMQKSSDTIIQKAKLNSVHECLANLDGISRLVTNTFNDIYELELPNIETILGSEHSIQFELLDTIRRLKIHKQKITGRIKCN